MLMRVVALGVRKSMLGAIAGDIIGSRYEGSTSVPGDFELFGAGCMFTDDTVCTIAVADALLNGSPFAHNLRSFARQYPMRGYGESFHKWVTAENAPPYGSWANGAPMRVSAIGWLLNGEEDVLAAADRQASVSHDHNEAIEASQAVALSILLARRGGSVADIRDRIAKMFSYDLLTVQEEYDFDLRAKPTVERALSVTFASNDWETSVRRAVMGGGDTDTVACISGSVAEALYGIPNHIAMRARSYLTPHLDGVVEQFLNVAIR